MKQQTFPQQLNMTFWPSLLRGIYTPNYVLLRVLFCVCLPLPPLGSQRCSLKSEKKVQFFLVLNANTLKGVTSFLTTRTYTLGLWHYFFLIQSTVNSIVKQQSGLKILSHRNSCCLTSYYYTNIHTTKVQCRKIKSIALILFVK